MNRKFIMGETFQDAMLKNIDTRHELSERDKLNWIDNILIIDNPLSLSSGDLELRLFTYKQAINVKQVRELTTTEEQCLNFISRLYKSYELKLIDNIFAIEFTQYDMDVFYNKIRINNSKINTVNKFNPINKMKYQKPISYINPNILNNKKIWRVILFENIDDYILRNSLENIDISKIDININDTQGLINELSKLSI
jgi:hypothetical protein